MGNYKYIALFMLMLGIVFSMPFEDPAMNEAYYLHKCEIHKADSLLSNALEYNPNARQENRIESFIEDGGKLDKIDGRMLRARNPQRLDKIIQRTLDVRLANANKLYERIVNRYLRKGGNEEFVESDYTQATSAYDHCVFCTFNPMHSSCLNAQTCDILEGSETVSLEVSENGVYSRTYTLYEGEELMVESGTARVKVSSIDQQLYFEGMACGVVACSESADFIIYGPSDEVFENTLFEGESLEIAHSNGTVEISVLEIGEELDW